MKYIPTNNFNSRPKDITAIVIHYTSSGSLDSSISWFKNPRAKASAHYLIDRNGSIVQMVKDGDRAWHAGISSLDGEDNVNDFSIGIELVNWGVLKYSNKKFYCWPDGYTRRYDQKKYGIPIKKNGNFWEPFPERQTESCIKLCETIRAKYSIAEDRVVGHNEISQGRKMDPGPTFPMQRLKYESNPILDDAFYMLESSEDDMSQKFGDRSDLTSRHTSLIERIKASLSWINS